MRIGASAPVRDSFYSMQTVYVGLSGGVDSAVSAALLKERGFTVVGAFIKIWQPEFIECTWREDRLDAMRVASLLQIPFREIDLSEEYKNEVISSMIDGYSRGITPNPDVLCNRQIKFGHFARWAFKEGADMVATGHYARIEQDANGFSLMRGRDLNKDQSYFLWQLTGEDLKRTLFPVGNMQKSDVRREASRFGLPVEKKADSQGLCFVGDITIPEFLARYISLSTGKVLNEQGEEIGEHFGSALYTLGQRHGFTVENTGTRDREQYVIALDVEKNTITVSPDRGRAARGAVQLHDVNWITQPSQFPCSAQAQTRYRGTPMPVVLEKKGEKIQAVFERPVIAAPGQSLVVYDGDRLLGGGVIEL